MEKRKKKSDANQTSTVPGDGPTRVFGASAKGVG